MNSTNTVLSFTFLPYYSSHTSVSESCEAPRELSYKRSPSRRFFASFSLQNARDHTTFTSTGFLLFPPSHISVSKSCKAPSECLCKQLPSHLDVARYRLSTFSVSSKEFLQSCVAPKQALTNDRRAAWTFAFFFPKTHVITRPSRALSAFLPFLPLSHISVSKSCEAPSERLCKQLPSRTDAASRKLRQDVESFW
ncbi:MAG: hypothetical protein PWP09_440 [Thermotogota bacterium]|nr:hypothetical protein [Thermotogota bacterium]